MSDNVAMHCLRPLHSGHYTALTSTCPNMVQL